MRKDFAPVLQTALRNALEYLKGLDDRPVGPTASLDELRAKLCKEWKAEGIAGEDVITDLVQSVEGGLNNSPNARFYAWVIGGSLPSALAADWLTSTWDQNAGMYAVSPASAIVEEAVGAWLKELFRLPGHTSFALVTGCQMAHATCLAAARSWLLKNQGWDVERQGMAGSPQIRVLCGVRHATIDRTLRLLGFGDTSLEVLSSNPVTGLDAKTLENALSELKGKPALVLLQAGDVNTGGFDNLAELIPIARKHAAWAHVDGAFGMWVMASPQLRTPGPRNGIGAFLGDGRTQMAQRSLRLWVRFCCRSTSASGSMSYHASYLSHQSAARDPLDWNPEFSRRARGFASYAAIRELGRNGVRELVERNCECAKQIVAGLSRLKNVEVLSEPIINQGLVAFLGADGRPSDEWNDRVIAEIDIGGHFLLFRHHLEWTPRHADQRFKLADLERGCSSHDCWSRACT